MKIYAVLTVGFLIFVIGGWWILHSAPQGSTERFSIYLLDTNEVAVSDENIVYYKKTSHEIKLTEEVASKIKQFFCQMDMMESEVIIDKNMLKN